MMISDALPRGGKRRAEYERSDATTSLSVPADRRLAADAIESALCCGSLSAVRAACVSFLSAAAAYYRVPEPKIRVLAARPVRVYEAGSAELFGDYDLKTAVIRVWMRTAVQRRVTSYGTFLSTLCHEFSHHLDLHLLGLPGSPHTRGFYERTAVLYHHCRGTPLRPLVWCRGTRGRWRIDWARMRRIP